MTDCNLKSLHFTIKKIRYLEKRRNVAFSSGLENYFIAKDDIREEWWAYNSLFNELMKKFDRVFPNDSDIKIKEK